MSQAKKKAEMMNVMVPQLVSSAISVSVQPITDSAVAAIAPHVFHTPPGATINSLCIMVYHFI
jgi:hypothetical protein